MQTIKLIAVLMTVFLGSSACTTIQLADDPIYTLKGNLGARVSYVPKTSQGLNHDISLKDWRAMEYGMVCMAPSTLLNFKSALKKLCSENKTICVWFRKEMADAEAALDSIPINKVNK